MTNQASHVQAILFSLSSLPTNPVRLPTHTSWQVRLNETNTFRGNQFDLQEKSDDGYCFLQRWLVDVSFYRIECFDWTHKVPPPSKDRTRTLLID
jgi:hypothetical protein